MGKSQLLSEQLMDSLTFALWVIVAVAVIALLIIAMMSSQICRNIVISIVCLALLPFIQVLLVMLIVLVVGRKLYDIGPCLVKQPIKLFHWLFKDKNAVANLKPKRMSPHGLFHLDYEQDSDQ